MLQFLQEVRDDEDYTAPKKTVTFDIYYGVTQIMFPHPKGFPEKLLDIRGSKKE